MKTKQVILFFPIFFFLFFAPMYSQWERLTDIRESRNDAQIQKEDNAFLLNSTNLDSFITATMSEYHIPGLSAIILKDDSLVWHNAYGYADVERKIPVTDSTLFDLASISKIITGTAIMQLYERGFLNLDDNVNNYLPADLQVVNPYYPNIPITCKMILSSVAGIGWDWNVMGKYVVAGDSPIPLFDFLKGYFVPGGAYYSNTNYNAYAPGSAFNGSDHAGKALLGYLVEAITDTSFEEYCQKHIFAPLGMNETSWFLANLDTSHIARPYEWTSSGYIPYPHRGIPWFPNGLLRTSSLQLARYLNAFMQKGTLEDVKILDSSTVALMTKAHYPEISLPSGLITMGLLWYQTYIGDRLVWGHWGSFDPGATTSMNYYEPEKSGVIVLANIYEVEGVSIIRRALFDYAAGIYLHAKIEATDSLNFAADYGEQDTSELTISNIGFESLKISGIQISGNNFHLAEPLTYPILLNYEESLKINLIFASATQSSVTDTLKIFSNDPSQPTRVVVLKGYVFHPAAANSIYAIAEESNQSFLLTLDATDSLKTGSSRTLAATGLTGLAIQETSGYLYGVISNVLASKFIKIDPQSGFTRELRKIPNLYVQAIAFDGDSLLGMGYNDHKLYKIHLPSGTAIVAGDAKVTSISGLAINPLNPDELWAVSLYHGKIYIFDRNGKKIWERKCRLNAHALAFDSGGELFALFYSPTEMKTKLAILDQDTSKTAAETNDIIIGSTGFDFVMMLAIHGNITTEIAYKNEFPLPDDFALFQNYPNPFNPSTTIEFALPKSAFVTLKIYNLLGEEVATLFAEQRPAGIHKINWDASGLASGVYFYRLATDKVFLLTKKLVALK